jgi:hypothetical protein
MKPMKIFLIALAFLTFSCVQGQDKNVYTTSSIEYLFSWSDVTDNGQKLSGPVRFAPVFNFQNNLNKDISEKFGLYLGLSLNNVGFIYDVDEFTRKKVRSYNLGIPVGIKIGNMNGAYLFGGYTVEFPLNYKEKTFIDEEKTKFNTWFSDRTQIQQAVMAGIQFPYGANIKFKYYFTDFYKKGYTDSTGQPYENFSGNAMVISLGIVFLRGSEFTYNK